MLGWFSNHRFWSKARLSPGWSAGVGAMQLTLTGVGSGWKEF